MRQQSRRHDQQPLLKCCSPQRAATILFLSLTVVYICTSVSLYYLADSKLVRSVSNKTKHIAQSNAPHPNTTLPNVEFGQEVSNVGKTTKFVAESNTPLTNTTLQNDAPRHAPPTSSTLQNDAPRRPFILHYSWKEPTLHPSWKDCKIDIIKYYSDDDVDRFVKQHRPSHYPFYRNNLSKIEQMDYFRYLVVYIHGGFWVDVDVVCLTPADKWLSIFGFKDDLDITSLDFVFGLEFPNVLRKYYGTGVLPFQLCQYSFGGSPKSYMMLQVLEYLENVSTNPNSGFNSTSVLQRTGPAAFTKAIVNQLIANGIPSGVTNRSDGVDYPSAVIPMDTLNKNGQLVTFGVEGKTYRGVILPYRAFAWHQLHETGQIPTLTRHDFWGSWRVH